MTKLSIVLRSLIDDHYAGNISEAADCMQVDGGKMHASNLSKMLREPSPNYRMDRKQLVRMLKAFPPAEHEKVIQAIIEDMAPATTVKALFGDRAARVREAAGIRTDPALEDALAKLGAVADNDPTARHLVLGLAQSLRDVKSSRYSDAPAPETPSLRDGE